MKIVNNTAYYRAALITAVLGVVVIIAGALCTSASVIGVGAALALAGVITTLHFQTRLLLSAARRTARRTEQVLTRQTEAMQRQRADVADAISQHTDSFGELARDIEVGVARQVPSVHGFDALQRKVDGLERILASMESILVAEMDAARQSTTQSIVSLQSSTFALIDNTSTSLSNELTKTRNQMDKLARRAVDASNKRASHTHQALWNQTRRIRNQIEHTEGALQATTKQIEGNESSLRRLESHLEELSNSNGMSAKSLDVITDKMSDVKQQIDSARSTLATLVSATSTSEDRDVQVAHDVQTAAARIARAAVFTDRLEALSSEIKAVISQHDPSSTNVLKQSLNEGFRATRVALEQVPQSVDQYHALRNLLAPDKLAMPPIGGWAMTSTAITEVVARILQSPVDPVVVELGSGVSTVWASLAMRKRGGGRVISLDHLEEYVELTCSNVASDGSPSHVELVHAPLIDTQVAGEQFNWYDLSSLSSDLKVNFLLIDGPPGTEGPQARYPALPLMADRLAPGAIILVDDTIRSEEQQILARWLSEFSALSVVRRLDKATVLKWSPALAN